MQRQYEVYKQCMDKSGPGQMKRLSDWIAMLRRASMARVNRRLQRYVGQLPNRTGALLIYLL